VKAGDVITSINGERIRTVGELREKLSGKRDEKDRTVKLGVLRNKMRSHLVLSCLLLPRGPSMSFLAAPASSKTQLCSALALSRALLLGFLSQIRSHHSSAVARKTPRRRPHSDGGVRPVR